MVAVTKNIVASGLVIATTVAVVAMVMITRKKAAAPEVIEPKTESRAAVNDPGKAANRTRQAEVICFERDESIYVKDLATGKERKVAVGWDADISPSGEEVAFMSGKYGDDRRVLDPPDWRRITILNLRTNETRYFETLKNVWESSPLWSPDGTKIAFQYFEDETSGQHIGILETATGTWKDITKPISMGSAVFLHSWTGDQSILFDGQDYLYEFTLDGRVLQKIRLDDLCERSERTSNTSYSLSADKRYLLFNRTIYTENHSSEPALHIVSLYDLVTKRISQVTPNTIDGWRPVFFGAGNEIMFTCLMARNKPYTRSICKIALDGSDLKVIVRDADYGSYSFK